MIYVEYEYYRLLFGEKAIPEADFKRLSWDAFKFMDNATTGIDGVKKLKEAFPTDEDGKEAVMRCACKLIQVMDQVEKAEQMLINGKGYVTKEDGTVVNKLISSISSGSESVSYFTGNNAASLTIVEKASGDKSKQEELYYSIIKDCLTGVTDAVGVNLLYLGDYPH